MRNNALVLLSSIARRCVGASCKISIALIDGRKVRLKMYLLSILMVFIHAGKWYDTYFKILGRFGFLKENRSLLV